MGFVIGCDRTHIPLKGVPSCCVVRNVVTPRAFMSSTPATEAFQGSSGSNAYGSDQIQVKYSISKGCKSKFSILC